MHPVFQKAKTTLRYLPHCISSFSVLLCGICLIIFSVSYLQREPREDNQRCGECYVFSGQVISNTTCPSGNPCFLYNLTYYLDIDNIRYYGSFSEAFQPSHLYLPFIQNCYYWNTIPPEIQLTKFRNSSALVVLFVILFSISLLWSILVFCFCKRQDYVEI